MKFSIVSSSFVAIAALLGLVDAAEVILPPPASAQDGKPIAVVWLHGMECKPEAYKTIATEFQDVAAKQGYKAWVGMPEFMFDVPQPVTIDSTVKGMVDKIKKAGWPGEKIYLAAHSLSGVFSQDYARDNADLVEGAILMGSVLLRKQREINEDGKTNFKGFQHARADVSRREGRSPQNLARRRVILASTSQHPGLTKGLIPGCLR